MSNRRAMLVSVLALGLVVGVTVRPAALSAQLTGEDRAALADLGPQFAQAFAPAAGWYRGRTIHYYDFGPQAVTISPMFLVVTGFGPDGRPELVPGQRPIFSSIPGIAGYSAIWQVHYVVVGPWYRANQLRDGRTAIQWALAGRARLVIPGFLVNCPVVPSGSSLADDPDRRAIETGWYKGQEVAFFDFGRSSAEPAPIHVFVTGFDGEEPRFVRAQGNIIDVVPEGDARYRDLWEVVFTVVPESYEPQTVRDLATATRFPQRRPGMVRNCPVILVDGVRAPRLAL